MILIDAETLLLDRPEYRNPIHEKNGEYNRGWNDCVDMFYDIIKGQSTAYDVDKVVEELRAEEEYYGNIDDDDSYYLGKKNAFEEAIDIVKRGGVTC